MVWAVLLSRAQDIDGVKVDELVALADGNLPEERRADVEARVAASPRATAMLEAQRRSLAATRAFADCAPQTLLVLKPARRRRPRPALALALATAVLVLVATVFATTRGGGPLDEAVALAAEPATETVSSHGLERSFAGVQFPDWGHEFGWHATGARRDDADGRAADTVYYEHMGHRIGYTVLDGESVGLPERGRRVVRDGLAIQLFHEGEKSVVVFERDGRTCVLAGKVLADETLVKLAAWRANSGQAT
jgi:hypothetical protein